MAIGTTAIIGAGTGGIGAGTTATGVGAIIIGTGIIAITGDAPFLLTSSTVRTLP